MLSILFYFILFYFTFVYGQEPLASVAMAGAMESGGGSPCEVALSARTFLF